MSFDTWERVLDWVVSILIIASLIAMMTVWVAW